MPEHLRLPTKQGDKVPVVFDCARLDIPVLDTDPPADSKDSSYSLQGLIDALSRRRKTDSSTHALEAGPFRLPARSSSRLR